DTEPGLNIVKSASRPSDNIAGATIDYTFTVTNTGNVTLTGIGVTDPLITTVSCLADTLYPTAETTCTGTHVLSQAEVDSGAVLNTATAHGTSPQGTDIAEDSNQVSTDIPANPGVSVDKSAGAPSGNNAGDTIVYTFTVTNTGNVTVTGIGVDDPQIDDITCAETTVAPGVATSCTGTYTLTQADIDNGSVTNTATADGTSPAGDPVSGISNTVNTNIVATPGIDLVKTGSASGERAGDTVDYSFTVSNTGNVTLTDLVISDPLISSISCPQTQLAPTSATVCTGSYTLTQADVDAGSVHNDAEASADTPHSGTVTAADGTDVSIAPGPGLDLVKQAGAVIDVDNNGVDTGDLLPYTFTVTNTGNVTMTSVAIQDPKISDVSCPAGSLAPGETLSCTGSYPLSQADVDAGAVINSAKATALGPNADPDLPLHPVSASDSVTTPIDQHPALSLTKSSNAKGTLKVSSTVVFTFLVTNTGNVVLNDITVSDPMLKSVSCPIQTLQPGQSTVCTGSPYTVTAQDAAKGKLVNTAIASTGFCPAAGCSTVSARSTVRLAVAKSTHLAYTGAEVSRSLMLGGAILLAGMVLVFAARRRRRND
ncbi:MAG TPA: hypothetical protein DCM67_09795, partial [Propionibacteriaceae bacterium]|nr:hypothetical protein [Propionibacteriaceae bacterium]